MLAAPPPPPPAIVAPAAREVSFGLVAGTAPAGTTRVIVRVGARVAADRPLRGQRFSLRVDLPFGDSQVSVTAVDGSGRRSTSRVAPVYGLPRLAVPRVRSATEDPALAGTVRSLTRGFRRDERSLRPGSAHRTRRRLERACTLPRRVDAQARDRGDGAAQRCRGSPPAARAWTFSCAAMLVDSDNASANALEVWLAGSTSGGLGPRERDDARARASHDSEMYGGYEIERSFQASAPTRSIPIRVESQPSFGAGKYTTAWDLARLARAVYLAAGGKGPLPRLGVSAAEARYLLWVLAHVSDGGKLGRFLPRPAAVCTRPVGTARRATTRGSSSGRAASTSPR